MALELNISLEEFEVLARESNVIPIYTRIFSGSESALGIYEKLGKGETGSFLLESAEHGVWARYSFVGVASLGFVSKASTTSELVWTSTSGRGPLPNGESLEANTVIDWIRTVTSHWRMSPKLVESDANFPPLSSGLIGVIGWDLVRELEKLGEQPKSDFNAPVLGMSLCQDMVAVDHQRSELIVISNVYLEQGLDIRSVYLDAVDRIQSMIDGIKQPNNAFLVASKSATATDHRSNHDLSSFGLLIEKAKEHVSAGDVFQVVISQRFDATAPADPLDAYRALRAMNPSPYMYFLNFEDEFGPYQIVGASPESLVQVRGRHVVTHPIAGSRPRGATPEADEVLSEELLEDHKERAEHLMLVDLARNDLLKVCNSSSVHVSEFMQIHRYSHVMHLVSTVEGQLDTGRSAIDAFAAVFPAGTLSGAPKPRALEIIDELESSSRGIYGGVVGYFDFAGNADLAIAIRTAFMRDGVARVQAGAGIVLDSKIESEYQETISKSSSSLASIAMAREFRRL